MSEQSTEKSVHSSHVVSIDYDDTFLKLKVTWNTGKVSEYQGVPGPLARQAMNAWSVGKFLTENIKNKYKHRYLK